MHVYIVIFSVLFCFINISVDQIQARQNVALVDRMPDFMEKRKFKEYQIKPAELTGVHEEERAEFASRSAARKKKRRKIIKHKTKKVKSKKDKKDHKPKKHIGRKTKTKSKWIQKNDNDSNMSGSKEKNVKGKPVDIIVHIKMNE